MAGPLNGIRIIEMGGIGPAPFAAMMLADHGAEVIRVERAGMIGFDNDPLRRSRRSISVDLKQATAREVVRRLSATANGLIEGYRPGVMERLGLGPDELLSANPRLVYGRVTGWGQNGPLAGDAGHDINYVALSGLLCGIGPKERPIVPINYLGDYAGGGMMLAFGMVSALLAVKSGANGQIIDAAMSDGSALIGAMTYGLKAAGLWKRLPLRRWQVHRNRSNRTAVPAGFVPGPRAGAGRRPGGNCNSHQEPHARRMGRPFCRHRRLCDASARS
jgi:alpha-methylacyl-CoA racemase